MKRARSFGLAERAMAFENWLLGRAWQDVRDSLCHGELGAARKWIDDEGGRPLGALAKGHVISMNMPKIRWASLPWLWMILSRTSACLTGCCWSVFAETMRIPVDWPARIMFHRMGSTLSCLEPLWSVSMVGWGSSRWRSVSWGVAVTW